MSSNAHPNPKTKIFQKANNHMMSKSSEENERLGPNTQQLWTREVVRDSTTELDMIQQQQVITVSW
jgi:hypothetical protein